MNTGTKCILFTGVVSMMLPAPLLRAAAAHAPPPARNPVLMAAQAEIDSSNRHDLQGFLRHFTANAVILADSPPYSFRGKNALIAFFKHSLLGSRIRIIIRGAPRMEDRMGAHAYVTLPVEFRLTDAKGDSFNDPGYWIGVLVRHGTVWKIDALNLTPW